MRKPERLENYKRGEEILQVIMTENILKLMSDTKP
jgi:hypothetical protein